MASNSVVFLTLNVLSSFPLDVTVWVVNEGSPEIFNFSVAFKSRFSMTVRERLLNFEPLDVESIV